MLNNWYTKICKELPSFLKADHAVHFLSAWGCKRTCCEFYFLRHLCWSLDSSDLWSLIGWPESEVGLVGCLVSQRWTDWRCGAAELIPVVFIQSVCTTCSHSTPSSSDKLSSLQIETDILLSLSAWMFVHVSACIHVYVFKKKGKLLEEIFIYQKCRWSGLPMPLYVNFM